MNTLSINVFIQTHINKLYKLELPHPEEIYTEKFVTGSVERKWHSLYYCEIHICLSRALVFWAARHTTVCLYI